MLNMSSKVSGNKFDEATSIQASSPGDSCQLTLSTLYNNQRSHVYNGTRPDIRQNSASSNTESLNLKPVVEENSLKIQNLKDDINRLEREVEQLKDKSTKHNSSFSSNFHSISNLEERLRALECPPSQANGNANRGQQNEVLYNLKVAVDTLTSRVSALEGLCISQQESMTKWGLAQDEVSLTLQTLQATSYDGRYIWKIPDITRRRREAFMGKIISLYSAPFHTDRFGYRMCLRAYLNGDGKGGGTHISYFLTIMKGEYDSLLEWPFHQTVTLTLINQKGNSNIVQSFKPNPNSASFQRPRSDMNVASGCPKFAPLCILDNKEFVVNDEMYFQAIIHPPER